MSFEVVVIANQHRKPLIRNFIEAKCPNVHIHLVDDFALPDGIISSEVLGLTGGSVIGPYRCWRGHRDAIANCNGDMLLVLEDDAVPNCTDWWEKVNAAAVYLASTTDFDVLSLHGREILRMEAVASLPSFSCTQVLKPQLAAWVQGSLAYFIKRAAMNLIVRRPDVVHVTDIFLLQHTRFCLIDPSPFNHGSARSVIAGTAYDT